MHVLVVTTATQGARGSDFAYVFRPEPVRLAPTCGRDAADPDGACGCARAFVGLRSRRPITTAAVAERDMTPQRYRSLLHHALRTAGYPRTYGDDETRRHAEHAADELMYVAVGLRPGTVLERRGHVLAVRDHSATAGLSHNRPVTDADPRRDNGFVSIDFASDDPDDVFPAWISPYFRWNGFAVPTFSRDVAVRVVDWTNRLHATDPGGAASARWDGEDILLLEPDSAAQHPIRISPDTYGRYHIGDSWTWTDLRCWICRAPARPSADDGSAVQWHEVNCPHTTPTDQWPLAAHELV